MCEYTLNYDVECVDCQNNKMKCTQPLCIDKKLNSFSIMYDKMTKLENFYGTSTPFTCHRFEKMKKFVTPTWLTHLWEYTDTCNIRLNSLILMKRNMGNVKNDFFLMDAIYESNVPVNQQLAFNQVRLFLLS